MLARCEEISAPFLSLSPRETSGERGFISVAVLRSALFGLFCGNFRVRLRPCRALISALKGSPAATLRLRSRVYACLTGHFSTPPSNSLAFSQIPKSLPRDQTFLSMGLRVECLKSPIFSRVLTGLRVKTPEGGYPRLCRTLCLPQRNAV
jgi:hypothetical protein